MSRPDSHETLTALHPVAPRSLDETGLERDLITDLALKALCSSSGLSGSEIARRIGVTFAVVEQSLEFLKAQLCCEIVGGSMMGGASFRYRLTSHGTQRAQAAFERSQYMGVAPVPIAQYRRYMQEFTRASAWPVSPEEVRRAFSDLVISEDVLNELGPAVNARHSIFIYGPPGNGKTRMAQAIRRLMTGTIAIPHALEVSGRIVRFFDPAVHEEVSLPDANVVTGERYDRRWAICQRPMVAVGGELTLAALALAHNAQTGSYRAPVQSLANGGILLIDDFGRQQCPPRELLNWWMVPLESRVEYMTMMSGEKVEMPFNALVIFSTNIRPADLVDEAFLRRIRYKIFAENPTPEHYLRIFERECADREIPFNRALVQDLLDNFYAPRQIALRACHPRDLINQALALASYQGQARQLTPALLEAACASYFITEDREASLVPA